MYVWIHWKHKQPRRLSVQQQTPEDVPQIEWRGVTKLCLSGRIKTVRSQQQLTVCLDQSEGAPSS